MRPAELLGMQADFLRRYSDTEENPDQRMLLVQVTAIDRQLTAIQTGTTLSSGDLSDTIRKGYYPPMAHAAVQHCARAAQGGMPIMVTPQMVDLVTWVANDFPETETIDLGIAPSPYGFVWLDKPFVSPGASDRVEGRSDPDTQIDLIAWSPAPRAERDNDPHAIAFLQAWPCEVMLLSQQIIALAGENRRLREALAAREDEEPDDIPGYQGETL